MNQIQRYTTLFIIKNIPFVTGDMDETVIITYSPKYKAYQSKIRNAQIDRAKKGYCLLIKTEKERGQMIRLVSSKNSDYRRWRNSSKKIFIN